MVNSECRTKSTLLSSTMPPKKDLLVVESLLLNLLTQLLSFAYGKPIMLIRPSVRIDKPTKVSPGEEFARRFTIDGSYVNVVMSAYYVVSPPALKSYDSPESVIATAILRKVGGDNAFNYPGQLVISIPDNITPKKQWVFWFDSTDTLPVVGEIMDALYRAHRRVPDEK